VVKSERLNMLPDDATPYSLALVSSFSGT